MGMLAPLDGMIARIGRARDDFLLEHWLRLPERDLRLRFLATVTEAHLTRQARRAVADGRIFAYVEGERVRGVGELYLTRGVAEAAFTVEPSWRGRGIGRALFRAVRREAARLGARRMLVLTSLRSRAMVRLGVSEGMTFDRMSGELCGALPIEREPARRCPAPGSRPVARPAPVLGFVDTAGEAMLLAASMPVQSIRMVSAWRSVRALPG